ncbi:hypothetical protein [Klebsiella phage 05F01]|nr:hypothetical protein [Klebsiella phage 05F01]
MKLIVKEDGVDYLPKGEYDIGIFGRIMNIPIYDDEGKILFGLEWNDVSQLVYMGIPFEVVNE